MLRRQRHEGHYLSPGAVHGILGRSEEEPQNIQQGTAEYRREEKANSTDITSQFEIPCSIFFCSSFFMHANLVNGNLARIRLILAKTQFTGFHHVVSVTIGHAVIGV